MGRQTVNLKTYKFTTRLTQAEKKALDKIADRRNETLNNSIENAIVALARKYLSEEEFNEIFNIRLEQFNA